MTPTEITYDVGADGVAVVTMAGADRLNLFSSAMARALGNALADCEADDAVRVIVLTGAGSVFCAGADLSADSGSFDPAGSEFSASPVSPAPYQLSKVVIAAITGHAIGIGLTLALQCDLRVVAHDAKLAIPQVRRGMVGDAGSHFTVRQLAGMATAAELLLTGRTISGSNALDRGLVNAAVPAGEVLDVALDLARDIAVQVSPTAVALSKQMLWSGLSLDDTVAAETAAHHVLMAHPDAIEGPAAWRDGREPRWAPRQQHTASE